MQDNVCSIFGGSWTNLCVLCVYRLEMLTRGSVGQYRYKRDSLIHSYTPLVIVCSSVRNKSRVYVVAMVYLPSLHRIYVVVGVYV